MRRYFIVTVNTIWESMSNLHEHNNRTVVSLKGMKLEENFSICPRSAGQKSPSKSPWRAVLAI